MAAAVHPLSARARRPLSNARHATTAVATAAATALVLGACVSLPTPTPVDAGAQAATQPQLAFWSQGTQPGSFGAPVVYFATDRSAYATVFEVDRAGRVRVVFPSSPARTAGSSPAPCTRPWRAGRPTTARS